jgi:hypothetical protein
MKIEQLLVQHLYNSKELSLQGIGTFHLSDSVVLPAENDKDFVMPADSITFTYDNKAKEDEALIDFIVQQTRKMKALATSDLDSFLSLNKQFLNIGKPFRIEGIGTLQKNQTGQFDFVPGQYISPRMEPAAKPLKEKLEEDISFRTAAAAPESSNAKKIAVILTGVLVLGAAAFGAWWFFFRKDNTVTTTESVIKADTAKMVSNKPDIIKPDTLQPPTPTAAIPAAASGIFKVVFLVTTDKNKAIARKSTLEARGHKVVMYTADSVTYKLAEPFSLPLSDTLRVKDSLGRWYYGKTVFIETN